MVVTKAADWARGGQGGKNVAANALLYHATHKAAASPAISSPNHPTTCVR